jgi:carboxymethylenebutenolidase
MPRVDVQIPTSDGVSSGSLHVPDGAGPWPGVVVFPDAFGLRDTMRDMGDHLASLGYVALVPDVFYRAGDWAPFDPATAFTDQKERGRLFGLMSGLTNGRVIADADAYADFLLARPEVRGTAVGTTGYCMGGRMSLLAAGGIGDKIAAAASFHAARVAIPDDPNSPHLAADNIRAAVYVAGSIEDQGFTAEHAELLDSALTSAGVPHTIEFYPGHHGFAVPDNAPYDPALADRHWEALRGFYAERLLSAGRAITPGRELSARQRSRQPEPRQHAGLETDHGADPVAAEGQDVQADPVPDAVRAGWPLARVGTRSNRRPEPNRLATKLTTASRPAYSKGIGGIDTNASSVRRATSASRSADCHALTNLVTIASSEGDPAAGGGSRPSPGGSWRRRLARARLRAPLTDSTVASSMPATSLAWKPRTSRRMSTATWRGGSTCRAVTKASEMDSACS